MKEHGMLYSPDMVLADLKGIKWQTRRPVTFENSFCGKGFKRKDWPKLLLNDVDVKAATDLPIVAFSARRLCSGEQFLVEPRVKPGHLLWFRETFWLPHSYPADNGGGHTGDDYQDYPPSACKGRPVHFDADGSPPNIPNRHYPQGLCNGSYAAADPYAVWHKHPSIHMPRWASRIQHVVAQVRVQRIQDISYADCLAEGMAPVPCLDDPALMDKQIRDICVDATFKPLWDSKYGDGPHAWKNNGLMWVYDYERTP